MSFIQIFALIFIVGAGIGMISTVWNAIADGEFGRAIWFFLVWCISAGLLAFAFF